MVYAGDIVLYPKQAGVQTSSTVTSPITINLNSLVLFPIYVIRCLSSIAQQSQLAYEDDASIYLAYCIRQRGLWRLQHVRLSYPQLLSLQR